LSNIRVLGLKSAPDFGATNTLVVPGTVVGIGAWIAPRFHFVTAVVLTIVIGGVLSLAYLYLSAHGFARTYPTWRTVLMVMFWIISVSFALFRARAAPASSARNPNHAMQPTHAYEIRPRKDKRSVDLISDALPFGRLWLLYLVESQNTTTFCSGFLSFNC
jgi:hypothetical protein